MLIHCLIALGHSINFGSWLLLSTCSCQSRLFCNGIWICSSFFPSPNVCVFGHVKLSAVSNYVRAPACFNVRAPCSRKPNIWGFVVKIRMVNGFSNSWNIRQRKNRRKHCWSRLIFRLAHMKWKMEKIIMWIELCMRFGERVSMEGLTCMVSIWSIILLTIKNNIYFVRGSHNCRAKWIHDATNGQDLYSGRRFPTANHWRSETFCSGYMAAWPSADQFIVINYLHMVAICTDVWTV